MAGYPDISDHGLIGDLQTAALVTKDGTVDWFCCPRFDSPSVFASLLDAEKGGYCRVRPDRDDFVTRQMYLPGTALLVTRFMTPDGVGEVTDFMPVTGTTPAVQHRLVRQLRCVRGTIRFVADIRPRFDYGRQPHKLETTDDGAVFHVNGTQLTVHTVGQPGSPLGEQGVTVQSVDNDLRVARTLHEGETAGMVIEWMGGPPRRLSPAEMDRLSGDSVRFWQEWLGRSTYTGRWREMVTRSAMTLKLMTYAPTGALVAAPTAGLPEQTGGERNWDYRYTWVRDGSLSVHALLGLGYVDEAAAFGAWLRDRVTGASGDREHPLDIMYRVDGSSDLVEETLGHFEGWRGSRPVRIGNGASDQLQLDIYGEALDAISRADASGFGIAHEGWTALAGIVDWLCDHWDQPEEGIWETRGGRQDFTYGRFQCWVALDRAIKLAERRGRPTSPGGGPSATGSTSRSCNGAGIRSAARSPSTTAPMCSTPPCCSCPSPGLSPLVIPCGCPRWTRWTPNSSPTAWSTGTTRARHRTAWRAAKAPSPCARSSTCRRWPRPDGWPRRSWSSRRC
jgi:GH15 family glucan-1,4-alpha-glucosidase